ncbi:50S ribosomal protein L21 [Myxococcota bacterium]|nr:50S ribosomal protein L21 [Myxococcota bacterium]
MYAVIRSGGKQHRVGVGQAVRLEKLEGEVGDRIELDDVLMVAGEEEARIGSPRLDGVKVVGTITAQDRGAKITIFKKKRRKGYRRKQGHRQYYTEVRVDGIEG